MQRLDCHVKEYAWGKRGNSSEVARLFAAGHKDFRMGHKTPYAELWMGTHPDGPAKVRNTAECLSSLIARSDSSSYLSNNNAAAESADEVHLPFIMKIMSIKHTLSLQVHPTKAQAAILHKRDPKNYPDRNHKPELAYALTRFELLCGFRPAAEILENMLAFPELTQVMGVANQKNFERLVRAGVSQDSDELKSALRACFSSMMYAQVEQPQMVSSLLESLKARISQGVRGCLIEDTVKVMEDTWTQFPGDVGCFAPLYVNHLILKPGECCFYAAEELHAYLSGECVECVGCSNNTIRAALTPKFIDRQSLMEVLNYRMTTPDYYMVDRRQLDGYPYVFEYAPDCKDFTLHEIKVSAEDTAHVETVELPTLTCASIMVIVSGDVDCEELPPGAMRVGQWTAMAAASAQSGRRGDIFFIPAEAPVRLVNRGGDEVLAYRTFSYEVGPDHASRIQLHALDALKLPLGERICGDKLRLTGADFIDSSIEMDGLI